MDNSSSNEFKISPEKMDFRAYSISWNLTKRCNLNCDHCYLDANFRGGFRTDELNTDECKRVIDQIAEVNPNAFLILTGGEPLLRPDIYELIRYAADKKFMVVLGTNGTLINKANAEKRKEAGKSYSAKNLASLKGDTGAKKTLITKKDKKGSYITKVPGKGWRKDIQIPGIKRA